jgi:hypothetical protein
VGRRKGEMRNQGWKDGGEVKKDKGWMGERKESRKEGIKEGRTDGRKEGTVPELAVFGHFRIP